MNRDVLRGMSYGVYIVTAWDDINNRFTGCVINSAMQITSEPVGIAISINYDNYTNSCIKKAGSFALAILAEDSDPKLIGAFGFSSGRETDKLAAFSHTMRGGVAVPDGACGYMLCDVKDTLETPTHTVFYASVSDGEPLADKPPMTYAYYHNVIKGKTAKNAPTYIPEKEVKIPPGIDPSDVPDRLQRSRWRCTVCGYEYNGYFDFEDVAPAYTCPICGVPKAKFEEVK